ncbi:PilZ domain-containing protein [Bradyrhizobium diazoefficiens]|uniref:PilZ domain-containing protein n=1 Tax=Bradyrhizobium diazoefficiens TaxID=1355477 RepID=UPI001FF01603|nr:PilZ domain-containing protein [Bradyrhizobium diazoefficiens]
MIEKRAAQRHRVFKGGTITIEGSGIACTVRNMSASGAAIDLEGPVALPQSFTLSIARDNFAQDVAQRQARRPRIRTIVHTM